MSSRVFLSLIQRGGICDALTALFHRKGVDDQMGGADQPCVHGSRGVDGDECIHECFVNAASKLPESLGEHKMRLRTIGVVLAKATGLHDGKVRSQAVADVLIGPTQFVFE
jgi:hypothetical protein